MRGFRPSSTGLLLPMLSFAGGYPCCCPGVPGSVSSETSEETSASTIKTIDVGGCSCIDGIAAQTYRIDVSGIVCVPCILLGGDCFCDDCDDLNASYFVEHWAGCIWRATFPDVCPKCNGEGYEEVRMVLDQSFPNHFRITVTFGNFAMNDPRIVFRKVFLEEDSAPYDCLTINDDLGWAGAVPETTCAACPMCTGEFATVHVSAA